MVDLSPPCDGDVALPGCSRPDCSFSRCLMGCGFVRTQSSQQQEVWKCGAETLARSQRHGLNLRAIHTAMNVRRFNEEERQAAAAQASKVRELASRGNLTQLQFVCDVAGPGFDVDAVGGATRTVRPPTSAFAGVHCGRAERG